MFTELNDIKDFLTLKVEYHNYYCLTAFGRQGWLNLFGNLDSFLTSLVFFSEITL